jgi:hypothetical protein
VDRLLGKGSHVLKGQEAYCEKLVMFSIAAWVQKYHRHITLVIIVKGGKFDSNIHDNTFLNASSRTPNDIICKSHMRKGL